MFGTIEKINVYRGTALVKKGDYVKKGDLLVDGYMTIKEQVVKINVLASLSIIAEEQFVYFSFIKCNPYKLNSNTNR